MLECALHFGLLWLWARDAGKCVTTRMDNSRKPKFMVLSEQMTTRRNMPVFNKSPIFVLAEFVRNRSFERWLRRWVTLLNCAKTKTEKMKHFPHVLSCSKMKPTVHAYVTVLCSTSLVVPVEGARCVQLHTVSKAEQTKKSEAAVWLTTG